ncbi:hypothetical protein EHS25_004829 [Saitozyma podzolica]|uniref:Major facilitator superfamily (MFS) profile domain-containing protein n=1 Tax=Saitozyma podzolica TaxID=1890683 RepID=A0A427Y324_9TREE|nr:hypothetical protein EHS25_004829 [Saitozyma podzolica]
MSSKDAVAGQNGDVKPESEYVDHATGQKGAADEYAYVEDTPEEKQLVRKIDRHLLPMLWVMYIFNYIDRTNIGNAKTGGIKRISSSPRPTTSSCCQSSSSRPSIFLPAIMFIWGCMSIGVKGVNSFGGMHAELSKRVAMFYTASLISGAFGGLLAGGIISGLEGVGGTRGWKWLFIIEGLVTVVLAIIAFFVLPDYPTTTKLLTEEEKRLALIRIAAGNVGAGEENILTHKQAFMASVKDIRTWSASQSSIAMSSH